ncbi:MAG TPA: hypothetical protein PK388_09930 [Kiritimatiellia bacterium]|nr:hypothetical protein [Kiritimatiellia bacterium]
MVKLTERDKRICAALPAVLVLAIYGWAFAWPVLRHTADLRAELRAQEPADARAERLAAAAAESERLAVDLAAARQEMEGLKSPAAADDSSNAARSRADTLHRLSGLCASSGVTLGSARQQADNAAAGAPVGELLKKMHWIAAERWRLEMSGSFDGMVRWLDGLSAAGLQALPTGLDMEPGAEANQPAAWSLDLWI